MVTRLSPVAVATLVVPAFVFAAAADDPAVDADAALARTLRVGDVERDYLLHLPPAYANDEGAPLVIALHGLTANAGLQMTYTLFNTLADAERIIVAYPQGLEGMVQGEMSTHWDAQFGTGTNDVAFISSLIDEIVATHNADAARVYVTGFSNGGFMTYRLACELSDKIAAAAPVAGQLPIAQQAQCDQARHVPILHMHGTNDTFVPLSGIPEFTLSVDDTAAFFAEAYGCALEPSARPVEDADPNDHSTLTHYVHEGCEDGGAFEYYIAENAGHTWPDAVHSDELGVTNRDINANEVMWAFFSRFRLGE